jgi:hypothetical protein
MTPEELINQLYTRIRDVLGMWEVTERVVIVEVNPQRVEFIIFEQTMFDTPFVTTRKALSEWAVSSDSTTLSAENRRKLKEQFQAIHILDDWIERLRCGFCIGQYAKDGKVWALLKEIFKTDFLSLSDSSTVESLPRHDSLEPYLRNRRGKAQFSLDIYAYDFAREGGRVRIHRKWLPLVERDTPVSDQPHDLLNEIVLSAASVGEEITLYVWESYNDEKQYYHYEIRPTQRDFTVRAMVDQGVWKIVTKQTSHQKGPYDTQSGDEQQDVQVTLTDAPPQICFVIESALGMPLLAKKNDPARRDKPSEGETDFEVLKEFCRSLLQTVSAEIPQAQFLFMFYGDKHEEPAPYEFARLDAAKYAPSEIRFLPQNKTFFSAENAEQQLNAFHEMQSITCDWQKSLEWAAHELRTLEWGRGDRIAIWIGQSEPHVHEDKQQHNLDLYGFSSPYDFEHELEQGKREQGIRHFAFFVSADVPKNLRLSAKTVWQNIPQEQNHFSEIRLDSNQDIQQPSMYQALRDFLREVDVRTVVKSTRPLTLPFARIPSIIRFEVGEGS